MSGMEGDIMVSDSTAVAPPMGEKRGSCTGKVTTLHFIDDQCLAIPDSPQAKW